MRKGRALLAIASALSLASGCVPADSPTKTVSSTPKSFPHSASADSLLTKGETVYRHAEYDSAEAILAAGRDAAITAGDSAALGRALTWLGLTAWKKGDYQKAQTIGERALDLKVRAGLKYDLSRSYNALGLVAQAEGRLTDAAGLFAKANTAARDVNDSTGIARALGNLGLVHADAGAFDLARIDFKTLREVAHQAGDSVAEGNALANLGMLEVRNGDASLAIEWLSQARKVYGEPSPPQKENLLGHFGLAYSALGESQRAIAYMDSALQVAKRHDMKLQQSENLQIIAEIFGESGDHQRALEHLRRARLLADSIGAEGRAGEIARAQARELALISRYDLARAAIRDAIAVHRSSGFRLQEMSDNLILAEIAQLSAQPAEAQRSLHSADSLALLLKLGIANENAALGRARVADLAVDPNAVLRALPADQAFPRMGPSAQQEAFAMRARAFARMGRWPEAVSSGRQAVARLEGLRQRIGEGPLRASFVSDQSEAYANLAVGLLRLGRTSDAFEVADAARGKSLLEHIAALGRNSRATTSDLAESQQLLRRIDWLMERLRLADTIPAVDRAGRLRLDMRELSIRLAAARREYEDRMKRVAARDPRSAALIGLSPVRASTIRSALTPGEVLIEYMATPRGLLIFAATRDTILWLETQTTLEQLAPRVRLAAELTSRRGNTNRPQVLRSLYDLLISPVDRLTSLQKYESVVIVPHSVLSYLPFSALVSPQSRYLIEDHSVVLLPSASSLPYLRNERPGLNENHSAIFAPFPEELPGSRAEALAVNRIAPQPVAYMGARATEMQLRVSFSNPGIVHVASHAQVNHASPMFSRIDVARGRSGAGADDGRFEVHELLGIAVKSQLVFLSGCETGTGAAWSTSFRKTQDYATLSQAFLYSGARDVIATLWKIDDRGASVFARRFYTELRTHSAAEALALAQRAMIHDPLYSSPRYWAAYTISGRGGSTSGAQFSRMSSVQ